MLVLAIHQQESAIGIPMSSPCWPSSHPSRLSQSTGFELPASYNKFPLLIYFACGHVYVSRHREQTCGYSEGRRGWDEYSWMFYTYLFWKEAFQDQIIFLYSFLEKFLKLWFLKQFPGNRKIRSINATTLRCYTSESHTKDKINHLYSLEFP